MASNDTFCRWGILSSANIARKNWKAIRLSGNGCVQGVSSRSADRAQTFIQECQAEVPFPQLPQAFDSHEALLESDQIDAVYIPLPTGLRKPWVIAAAEAKKHVLVEKPVAVTAEDAREMREACRANGVLLMDGVMFDHSQRVIAIADQVSSGQLGPIRRIQTHFSFASDEEFRSGNIRTDAELEPHGCLGDLGWYCLRFILWANQFRHPVQVSGRTITPLRRSGSDAWVPGQFAGELVFEDGVTAGFFCSFLSANQQLAVISGEQSYLTVDDFVLPLYDSQTHWQVHRHELEIANCRWNFRRRTESLHCDEYHSGEPNAPEVQMVRTFAELAGKSGFDPEFARRAVQTQTILNACRQSDADAGRPVPLPALEA